MTKTELTWLNKIHPLGSLEDVFFKKFITLTVTNETNHKKISFKIKGFKDPGKSFVILKNLQNQLHHFYDVDFATSSKDLDSIKQTLLQLIPDLKQEDFALELNKKTYELLCKDENTLNAFKKDEFQAILNIVGINHTELLHLMPQDENNNENVAKQSKVTNEVSKSISISNDLPSQTSIDQPSTSNQEGTAKEDKVEAKPVAVLDPKQAIIEKYQSLNIIHSTAVPTSLLEVTTNAQLVNKQILVEGEIFKIEKVAHERKNTDGHGAQKTIVYNIYITDHQHAMCLNALISDNSIGMKSNLCETYLDNFKEGLWVKSLVKVIVDKYEHDDQVGKIEKIMVEPTPVDYQLGDASDRVELDFHTNMSAFDGLHNPADVIKYAKEMKIKALSINDFNSAQSFPNLYRLAKDQNVNLIYGAEFDLLNNNLDAVYHPQDFVISNHNRLVFFDLETTGLAPNYNEIIEFGAYITDLTHTYVDKYQSFIRPEGQIDEKITKLTRITSDLLAKGKPIKEFLEELHSVIKDTDILVAHNGINFDIKFLNSWCRKLGVKEFNNPLIDTLILARAFITDIGGYSLGKLSHYFKLEYDEEAVAHRADADAEYLNNVFWKIIDCTPNLLNKPLPKWNILCKTANLFKKSYCYRICLQARYINHKDESSIKKLYQLISQASTADFNNKPLLTLQNLAANKEWFVTSCSAVDGGLIEQALGESDEDIIKYMQFYDYVKIAPLSCYQHLFPIYGKDIVVQALEHLIKLAKDNHILLTATSNAYYFPEYFKIFHKIYILTKSIGNKLHRYNNHKEDETCVYQPLMYVRNSKQMLDQMHELIPNEQYLKEVVIDNPNKVLALIEPNQVPIQTGLFPPHIEGVDEKLKEEVYKNARQQYGDELPKLIQDRLNLELDIIIKNGYSVVYWISHLLVIQSLSDHFLVGSRGSVGSSLVATFLKITEINPLQAHYYCKKCHYFETDDKNLNSGYDLPKKKCPKCGEWLIGEGQNIPFATFLGFKGDKIPDIDLNFSGLYQSKAHNFIREMFGKEHAFRAGTISTVAEKTAFAYVKDYLELLNQEPAYAYKKWLASNCMNVKRTTGQHPGGVVIVPKDKTIYDFTPYNFPADDIASDWFTTHFEFENIHDNLLKFDILGHDDPTVLKYLSDMTKIDPRTIPTHDDKVISLFNSTKALNIPSNLAKDYNESNGAIGLPEFGTRFVRGMLEESLPNSFSDLVRISGLSHGTNVWANNQQLLIKQGKHLNELVTCRDDIMLFLASKGIEPLTAFKIMEDIRKGRGIKPEYGQIMQEHVPSWYIDACKKIVYLFPKAHAAAYVLSAWRIAWFKVYYPLAYYATYFSVRCEVFDLTSMMQGINGIKARMQEIKKSTKDKTSLSKRDQDLYDMLEVALEMCYRGYKFSNIDLKKSDATLFVVDEENKAIIPPFTVLDGLGKSVADSIVQARKEHAFDSLDDFKKRTNVNKNLIVALEHLGVFKGLSQSNQLCFDFGNLNSNN